MVSLNLPMAEGCQGLKPDCIIPSRSPNHTVDSPLSTNNTFQQGFRSLLGLKRQYRVVDKSLGSVVRGLRLWFSSASVSPL